MSGDQVDDLEGGHRQLRARTEDGAGARLVEEIVILQKLGYFEMFKDSNRF